jgi:hypothetical protein
VSFEKTLEKNNKKLKKKRGWNYFPPSSPGRKW